MLQKSLELCLRLCSWMHQFVRWDKCWGAWYIWDRLKLINLQLAAHICTVCDSTGCFSQMALHLIFVHFDFSCSKIEYLNVKGKRTKISIELIPRVLWSFSHKHPVSKYSRQQTLSKLMLAQIRWERVNWTFGWTPTQLIPTTKY